MKFFHNHRLKKLQNDVTGSVNDTNCNCNRKTYGNHKRKYTVRLGV